MTLRISAALSFAASPLANVFHRSPGLGRRERLATLEQLDGDEVRRSDKCHPAVARRTRDRVAEIDEAPACGVNIVDFVRDVAEVAAMRVGVGLVPVVGQLDL